ncbi:MAG TPA: alpha/beta hydrolase [Caldilineaceae bacterium]|nr:alpha/beta hydrolase [Caldilineaceae bacterium]
MICVESVDGVALDHQQLWLAFCRAYPARTQTIAGVPWSYIVAGQGREVVVLLPGALGSADTAFHYLLAFAPRYRVLSLDYPPAVDRANALLAGIVSLLDREATGAVHLVGGSYSGPVAHALAQRHPALVRSLIFSNTGLPAHRRVATLAMMLALITQLPPPFLQWGMRRSLRWWLSGTAPLDRFWRDYFAAHVGHYDRRFLGSRARILCDLCNGSPAPRKGTTRTVPAWQGPVLIVDAPRDPLFTAQDRARLRACYPAAVQMTVAATGHGSALTATATHVAAYRRFWEMGESWCGNTKQTDLRQML